MKTFLPSVIIIIAVLLIGIAAAYVGLQPAGPLTAGAPAGEFSAFRAMEKLKVIAARPHPTGFVANRFVRDYLVSELTLAGLQPRVRPARVERNGNFYDIENIIAVLPGTGGKEAGKILLSAHYDARGEAPGAGDNGYAVAAVLETLRALKSHPPLKNDLVIFFPDGEELGSLGAKAFISREPVSDSIGLVLNFDGRGSSGPSLMFETSTGNLHLIREFNKAKTSSFSNSLSDEVYRLIPNYTDFTWFLKKAPMGLNFAHVGSVENYHASTDDIAHLDAGTFQSHGNSMLGCVLHFGNISLGEDPAGEAVFFHMLFPGLIIYPAGRAFPFALIAALLFTGLLVYGIRKRRIKILPVLAFAGIFLLRILLTGMAVYFTWKITGPMNQGFGKHELDWVPNGDYIFTGFLSAPLVIFLLWQPKMTRRSGPENVAMGTLLIWMLLAVATSLWFRGGSYLFLWPLLSCMIPILIVMKKAHAVKREVLVLLAAVFALPGIFLFSQVIWLFYETMTLRMAAAIAAMFMIMLGTLQLPLSLALSRNRQG